MVLLWERDDHTVGELGQRLFLESNNLTPNGCWRRSARFAKALQAIIPFRKIQYTDPVIGLANAATAETREAW
jgi:hypothetical protein